MQKKISDILLIILLAVLTLYISASIVLVDSGDISFYENRDLSKMPAVSKESVLDGSFGNAFESWASDHTPKRDAVLKLKAAIDMFVLKRPVVNDIVVTDDILLPYNSFNSMATDEQQRRLGVFIEEVEKVQKSVSEYGGKFVFVTVPSQTVYYSSSYPAYLALRSDVTDVVIPRFKAEMQRIGVTHLDMLEKSKDAGNPDYMSSKTDHHYSMHGAVYTWRSVVDVVNESKGKSLYFPDDSAIDYTELKNPYLGSRNRKIMGLKYNDERLVRAELKEPVPFERYNNGSLGAPLVYAEPEDDTSPVAYTYYMGGDFGNTVIKTHREELPDVLIYGASFTNAIESIAYSSCDEMHSIDLRSYNESTLSEYIKEHKPDVVVAVFDWSNLATLDESGKF